MSRASSSPNLRLPPDKAILRLARVLARQAAREDHERELAAQPNNDDQSRDLRQILDRPAK
jgi:hypothetical protein